MPKNHDRRTPLWGLLLPLALIIIIVDQATKAYFVYRLGSHDKEDWISFALEYFSLFAVGNGQAVIRTHYQPLLPPIRIWSPWLEFNLTTNTGAAWSMFQGNSFVLSFVSIAMALLLLYIWWRSFRYHQGMTWALGAIIGGALGNFLDRFRLREVVDFIDVKIPYLGRLFPQLGDPYDFPIFNIADSCAVCGTIALASFLVVVDLRALRNRRRRGAAAVGRLERGLPAAGAEYGELSPRIEHQQQTVLIGLTRYFGSEE